MSDYIILAIFIGYIFVGNGVLYMTRKETKLLDNGFQKILGIALFPIVMFMFCVGALFDPEYK